MSKQIYNLRSPRLTRVVYELLEAHGYTNRRCQEQFDVGPTFMSELRMFPERDCRADIMQAMYEELTGRPLMDMSVSALLERNPPGDEGRTPDGGQPGSQLPTQAPLG